MFAPALTNLWWSSFRVCRECGGQRPRALRGTLRSLLQMVHQRQQCRPSGRKKGLTIIIFLLLVLFRVMTFVPYIYLWYKYVCNVVCNSLQNGVGACVNSEGHDPERYPFIYMYRQCQYSCPSYQMLQRDHTWYRGTRNPQ